MYSVILGSLFHTAFTTCRTIWSNVAAKDNEGSLLMRFTASCAATWGRALAKRGSHSHGPTTPTRNQAACTGVGRKHRETRRRRNLWRPQRIMENRERYTKGWGEWYRAGWEEELRVMGQGLLPCVRDNDEGTLLWLHSCIDLPKPKMPQRKAVWKAWTPGKTGELGDSKDQLLSCGWCSIWVKNNSKMVRTRPYVKI